MSLVPFKHDLADLVDTPQSFAGVAIVDAGADKFMLPNEVAFFRNTFRLNTQADELGLAITGFVFLEEVTSLTDFWGRAGYRKIQITDPAYQSGTLYAFGDVAGSVVGSPDVNRLQDQIIALDTNLQSQIDTHDAELADHEERVAYLEDAERPNFIANPLNRNSLLGIVSVGEDLLEWSADTSLMQAGALHVSYPVSGTGRYLDIPLKLLNAIDVGQTWFVRFAIKLVTAADDLLSVVLFDGVSEIPTALPQIAYSGGMAQIVGGAVLPSAVLTDVVLRIKIKDNAVTELFLADVSVGPQNTLAGAAIGNTQRYVSTFSNIESVLTFRRVGSWLMGEVSLRQLSTTNILQSHPISSILPPGLSIDWSVFSSSIADDVISLAARFTRPGVNRWWGAANLQEPNNTIQIEPSSWVVSNTLNTLSPVAGDYVNIEFRAPIAQWTSNVNLASDFQEFAYNTSTTTTTDTTSFGYGSEGAAIQAFAPVGTVSVEKRIRFQRPILSADSLLLEILVNNRWLDASSAYLGFRSNDAGTIYSGVRLDPVSTSFTDVSVLFQSVPFTGGTWNNEGLAGRRWRVRKISNGNMAEIPPVVRAEYGNMITIGAAVPLNYATRREDTHNAVTTGASWKFTAPISGVYLVSAIVASSTSSYGRIGIYKNNAFGFILGNSANVANARSVCTGTIRLLAGDFIDIRAMDFGLSADNSPIQITRIGS